MLDLNTIDQKLLPTVEYKYNQLVRGLQKILQEYVDAEEWNDTMENIEILLQTVEGTKRKITVDVVEDVEAFLIELLPDVYIDGMSSVYPVEKWNLKGTTKFIDEYEGTCKHLSLQDLANALDMLFRQVGKTLWVGGITNPLDLTDAGNWDVEVGDAFYQLAYYGEVIYG